MQRTIQRSNDPGLLRMMHRLPVLRVAALEIVGSTVAHMLLDLSLLVKLLLIVALVLSLTLLLWKTKPGELERVPRIKDPGLLRDLQDVLHMYVRFVGTSVYHRTLYVRVLLLLNVLTLVLNATFLGTWEITTLKSALVMVGISLTIMSTLYIAKEVADPDFSI